MEDVNIGSKCPNCGSTLEYDPKTKNLKCISCSSFFPIESFGVGKLDDEELDYEKMISKLRNEKLIKQTVSSLNCKNCGAILVNEDNTISTTCPFCGSNHILETQMEEEIIPIAGVVPFAKTTEDVNQKFHTWIKKKMFAPSQFKESTFSLDIHPLYLPFWTFDMNCYSRYIAQRGDYYDVKVVKTDMDGNKRTETVREIRWSFRSGSCQNNFDDLMVLGTRNSENRGHINRVCNFTFGNLEKFNPKFLIGYAAEKISLPLEDGLKQAKQEADILIQRDIEFQVGGDVVRILECDTKYKDITFKQILVPIYNGLYNYNGKQYSFAMNGQNAKISGGYPVSGIKVFLFVMSIILPFIILLSIVISQTR